MAFKVLSLLSAVLLEIVPSDQFSLRLQFAMPPVIVGQVTYHLFDTLPVAKPSIKPIDSSKMLSVLACKQQVTDPS